jgi:hypothetical protein
MAWFPFAALSPAQRKLRAHQNDKIKRFRDSEKTAMS